MAKKWSAAVMIPTSSEYANRITGASFSPSKSSGNPMVTVECEVVTPQEVEVGGEQVNIAGVSTTNYFVTTVIDPKTKTVDEEATAKKRGQFREFWEKCGLDSSEINWDNIEVKKLEGKVLLTQMESEMEEKRATPTAEQIAKAKEKGVRPEGTIMKNPVTGKPLVNYWPKIREFFGLSPDQTPSANPY